MLCHHHFAARDPEPRGFEFLAHDLDLNPEPVSFPSQAGGRGEGGGDTQDRTDLVLILL